MSMLLLAVLLALHLGAHLCAAQLPCPHAPSCLCESAYVGTRVIKQQSDTQSWTLFLPTANISRASCEMGDTSWNGTVLPRNTVQLRLTASPRAGPPVFDASRFAGLADLVAVSVVEVGNITTIAGSLCAASPRLQALSLDMPDLQGLSQANMAGCHALTVLNVKSSRLGVVDADIFNDCTSLGSINMAQASLTGLRTSNNSFANVPLTQLDLSDNPQLFAASTPTTLGTLPKLSQLALINTGISDLGFVRNTQLQQLNLLALANNAISTLPSKFCANMPQLIELYLTANRLTSFTATMLNGPRNLEAQPFSPASNRTNSNPSGCTSLRTLHLGYNFITTITSYAFHGMAAISDLSLANNPLSLIEQQAWEAVQTDPTGRCQPNYEAPWDTIFIQASTSQGLHNSEYGAPVINLQYTLLTEPVAEAFAFLPASVLVLFGWQYVPNTTAITWEPLKLSACCGQEWLANSNTNRFIFTDNSIVCRDSATNTYIDLGELVGSGSDLFCPCLPPDNIFLESEAACRNRSKSVLVNHACRNITSCQSGFTLTPRPNGQSKLITRECIYPALNVVGPGGGGDPDPDPGPGPSPMPPSAGASSRLPPINNITSQMVEMACRPCTVAYCDECLPFDLRCLRCSENRFLFENQLCVEECPPGYTTSECVLTATSSNLPAKVCRECETQFCAICNVSSTTCEACFTPFALHRNSGSCVSSCPAGYYKQARIIGGRDAFECVHCTELQCQSCPLDPTICTACFAPVFIFNGGTSESQCVVTCPSGYRAGGSEFNRECVPETSDNSLSAGQIAGITVGALLFSATVVLYVYLRSKRKHAVIETDLREKLLDSATEIDQLRQAWQILPEELVLKRRIDSAAPGAFGEVWLATLNGNYDVAVKKLSADVLLMDSMAADDFKQEVSFMQTVRHPNLVQFFGAGTFATGEPFLVTEFMSRGALSTILANSPQIAWESKLRFAYGVALGMNHLHSLKRAHRDLKSMNVLIGSDFKAKVADFGQSTIVRKKKHKLGGGAAGGGGSGGGGGGGGGSRPWSTGNRDSGSWLSSRFSTMRSTVSAADNDSVAGTPALPRHATAVSIATSSADAGTGSWGGENGGATAAADTEALFTERAGTIEWMAPEIIAGRPYGLSADLYSYGVVLWELLTQQLPWLQHRMQTIARLVSQGRRPDIPEDIECPPAYRELMVQCWDQEPSRRPSFAAIVQMDMFGGKG